jgi:hypothetical protein
MKKIMLVMALSVAMLFSQAQKGTNYIGIAAEVGLPTGDFGEIVNVGYGGSLKALLGVTQAGQVSFTTGYTSFGLKGIAGSGYKAHYSIAPLLFGYRHNFSGFFIEPQLGMAVYALRASGGGMSASDSKAAFTWAFGLGYVVNAVEFGARYQSGKINDADSPFSLVGIHVG